jgi:metal-dependent HD superfamily phosphatase/phosphodiesterase
MPERILGKAGPDDRRWNQGVHRADARGFAEICAEHIECHGRNKPPRTTGGVQYRLADGTGFTPSAARRSINRKKNDRGLSAQKRLELNRAKSR